MSNSSITNNGTPSANSTNCDSLGDVAGPGVVYATLTLAILSTVLSILMVLIHPHYNREGSLFSWIRLSHKGKRGKIVTIMEDTLRSLGITQLITALALVISAWKQFLPDHLNDPHAALAISQALLASYSHMAPLGVLLGSGNIGKKSFLLRFAANLTTSGLATHVYFHPTLWSGSTWQEQSVMLMSVLSCALVLVLEGIPLWSVMHARGRTGRKEIAAASPPAVARIVVGAGTVCTAFMLWLTIQLKFFSRIRGCNMLNGGEDGEDGDWGFGQLLAILMLAAVALSIFEEFTDVKVRKSKKRHAKLHYEGDDEYESLPLSNR